VFVDARAHQCQGGCEWTTAVETSHPRAKPLEVSFVFSVDVVIRFYAWANVSPSLIAQARVSTSALFAIVDERELSLQFFSMNKMSNVCNRPNAAGE
jgi:hypothetical protein